MGGQCSRGVRGHPFFYAQWFERLGLEPISVLIGDLLMLAFAIGLWMFNERFAAGQS